MYFKMLLVQCVSLQHLLTFPSPSCSPSLLCFYLYSLASVSIQTIFFSLKLLGLFLTATFHIYRIILTYLICQIIATEFPPCVSRIQTQDLLPGPPWLQTPTLADVSNQPEKLWSWQKRSRVDSRTLSLPFMSHLLASRTAGMGLPLCRQTLLSRSCFHCAAASKLWLLVRSNTTRAPIAPL